MNIFTDQGDNRNNKSGLIEGFIGGFMNISLLLDGFTVWTNKQNWGTGEWSSPSSFTKETMSHKGISTSGNEYLFSNC